MRKMAQTRRKKKKPPWIVEEEEESHWILRATKGKTLKTRVTFAFQCFPLVFFLPRCFLCETSAYIKKRLTCAQVTVTPQKPTPCVIRGCKQYKLPRNTRSQNMQNHSHPCVNHRSQWLLTGIISCLISCLFLQLQTVFYLFISFHFQQQQNISK